MSRIKIAINGFGRIGRMFLRIALEKNNFDYTKAVLYRTECSDLSDLADVNYDILVFYSPSGIKSLFQNFPDFKQNNTKIASFGASLNPNISGLISPSEMRFDST